MQEQYCEDGTYKLVPHSSIHHTLYNVHLIPCISILKDLILIAAPIF